MQIKRYIDRAGLNTTIVSTACSIYFSDEIVPEGLCIRIHNYSLFRYKEKVSLHAMQCALLRLKMRIKLDVIKF